MWLLFHRNAKTRFVRDGETFVETCPECGERATFREVELTESYGAFFVDLVSDQERAFRCNACGEVFDLKDRAPDHAPAPAPVATKSVAELEREQRVAAERRRLAAETRATRIEDELAELKKRMGR
ncbi:MAG TPA: hypothetical protein VFQ53_11335 [Kofleriaceae bacterium]|nr:hypothetical protein [Kofleriaceae bacterium]